MKFRNRSFSGVGGSRQRGISLVVVLILLIVTSLLGVVVMRSAAMQERMSANLRDRSLAFEAAESTLRYVQDTVLISTAWEQRPPTAAECSASSVCPMGSAAAWRSAPTSAYDAGRLPAAPEYWVEYVGQGVANKVDDDNFCKSDEEVNNPSLDCRTQTYRVTVRSRSVGRADVVIQANVVGSTQQAGL